MFTKFNDLMTQRTQWSVSTADATVIYNDVAPTPPPPPTPETIDSVTSDASGNATSFQLDPSQGWDYGASIPA